MHMPYLFQVLSTVQQNQLGNAAPWHNLLFQKFVNSILYYLAFMLESLDFRVFRYQSEDSEEDLKRVGRVQW